MSNSERLTHHNGSDRSSRKEYNKKYYQNVLKEKRKKDSFSKQCAFCGQDFLIVGKKRKMYCSVDCRVNGITKANEINCKICGVKFVRYGHKTLCCSKACMTVNAKQLLKAYLERKKNRF